MSLIEVSACFAILVKILSIVDMTSCSLLGAISYKVLRDTFKLEAMSDIV